MLMKYFLDLIANLYLLSPCVIIVKHSSAERCVNSSSLGVHLVILRNYENFETLKTEGRILLDMWVLLTAKNKNLCLLSSN